MTDNLLIDSNHDLASWRANVHPARAALYDDLGWLTRFSDALGCHLVDESGRRYLDLMAGYGTAVLGHRHPEVVAALCEVLAKGAPFVTPIGVPARAGDLASRLVELAGGNLERAVFCTGGAEAVSVAMKFAVASTGRSEFMTFGGGFHGLIPGPIALTGPESWRDGVGPIPGPVVHRVPLGALDQVESVLRHHQVAAVVFEAVQGLGGARPWPDEALAALAELTRRHGALLIADEVLTGIGRTGKWFAYQHSGVSPDIVVTSKGLTGGAIPVAATLMTGRVHDSILGSPEVALKHSSTFEAHLLGMTSGCTVLDVIERDGLCERAQVIGARIAAALRSFAPLGVPGVRGRGLLLAFKVSGLAHPDDPDAASYCADLLMDNGVLVGQAAHDPAWIKLTPALTIGDDDVGEFLEILEVCLSAVAAERAG